MFAAYVIECDYVFVCEGGWLHLHMVYAQVCDKYVYARVSSLTHGIAVQQQHTMCIGGGLKAHVEGMHSIAIHLVLQHRHTE